jgi:hypothetical protein
MLQVQVTLNIGATFMAVLLIAAAGMALDGLVLAFERALIIFHSRVG